MKLPRHLLLGLLLVATLLGIAAHYLAFPAAPLPRPVLDGAMAALQPISGHYRDATGRPWLITPALDQGYQRVPLDRWGPRERGASVLSGLRRDPMQRYALSALQTQAAEPLQAWLFEPSGGASGNAIVLLHGSGQSDRSNSWYLLLADRLASAGHLVLLPDKRGSGRSAGDWREAGFEQLAADGAAWLDLLRKRAPGLATGFVGVSQGGFIAPRAAKLADADFVVALSSAATSLREQLQHELGNDLRTGGAPAWLRPLLLPALAWRVERRQPRFWQLNGEQNMLGYWRAWRGPTWIALGADDEFDNLPVELSLQRLSAEAAAAELLSWRVYPGCGHALVDAEQRLKPELLADLLAWLQARRPRGDAD